MDAGRALHLDIRTAVAVGNAVDFIAVFVSVFVLLVLLVAALGGRGGRVLGAGFGDGPRRSSPSWDFPDDSGETLELEAALGPSPAGLARPIEGTEARVDGSLVSLGTKLMGRRAGRRTTVVDSTVLPV